MLLRGKGQGSRRACCWPLARRASDRSGLLRWLHAQRAASHPVLEASPRRFCNRQILPLSPMADSRPGALKLRVLVCRERIGVPTVISKSGAKSGVLPSSQASPVCVILGMPALPCDGILIAG
jgi:hypothetical protein